jgi:hypothetical protein
MKTNTSSFNALYTNSLGILDPAPGSTASIVGNLNVGFASGTAAPSSGLLVSGKTIIGSSTSSVTNSRLEVQAGYFFATYSTTSFPTLASNTGLAISTNHSAGLAEINFFNNYNVYNSNALAYDFWAVNAAATGYNRQFGIYNNGGISIGQNYSNTAPLTGGAIFEGSVGIGDTSPGSKLSIVGNLNVGFASGTAAPTSGACISGLVAMNTSTVFDSTTRLTIAGGLLLADSVLKSDIVIKNVTQLLTLGTYYTSGVGSYSSINSSGVGAGTAGTLILNQNGGTVAINNTGLADSVFVIATSSTNITLEGDNQQNVVTAYNSSNTTNNWSTICFRSYNSAVSGAIGFQNTDQTNAYGDFAFATRSAAGFSEKMRLTSTGILAVGTSTPITTSNNIFQIGIIGTVLQYSQGLTSTYLRVRELFEVDMVGFATNITNTGVQDNVAKSSWAVSFGAGSTLDHYKISRYPAGSSSRSDFFLISSSGNVGINDTGPGSKLSVVGNACIGQSAGAVADANSLSVGGKISINNVSAGNNSMYINCASLTNAIVITGAATGTNLTGVQGIYQNISCAVSSGTQNAYGYYIYPNPVSGAGTMGSCSALYIDGGPTNTVPGFGYNVIIQQPNYGTANQKFALSIQGGLINAITATKTGAYTATTADYYIPCSTAGGAFSVTLPATVPAAGWSFVIKDAGGQADTNNLTINGGGHNIDGASTLVVNTAYGVKTIYSNGAQYYTAGGGSSGGSANTFQAMGTSATMTNIGISGINIVGCTAGGITVSLPATVPAAGWCARIKDQAFAASSSNITISGNGHNIDQASTYVMATNGMSVDIYSNGTLYYIG